MHCHNCGHPILGDKDEICAALFGHFLAMADYVSFIKQVTVEEFEAFEEFMRNYTE